MFHVNEDNLELLVDITFLHQNLCMHSPLQKGHLKTKKQNIGIKTLPV